MGTGSSRWRRATALGAFIALVVLALCLPAIAHAAGLMPVYRFYNMKTGTHFYTASEAERANVQNTLSATYRPEGVAYTIDTDNPKNSAPLFRFYNFKKGVHFYTASVAERNAVNATLGSTYRDEGVAYNVSLDPVGTSPVYRFFYAAKGAHFFTASESEKNSVLANLVPPYTFEGTAFWFAGATPPAPGDVTAPTTTSNALPSYVGNAAVTLTAVDNAGGSGVAHTYFKLDGGVTSEGSVAYTDVVGAHSVEFWSVDMAGNVEGHHTVNFTIVANMPWHVSTETFCLQSGCHFSSLTAEHYRYPIDEPVKFNCATCHAAPGGFVAETIGFGSDDCSDCHAGSVGGAGIPVAPVDHITNAADNGHALPAVSCTDTGCHSGTGVSLASIHADAALPGVPRVRACGVCHDGLTPPPSDCTDADCHGASFAHPPHTPIASTGAPTCTTASCHPGSPTAIGAVHTTCGVCHGSADPAVLAVVAAGMAVGGPDAVCEDCHTTPYDTIHSTLTAPHLVDVAGCSVAGGCHPTPFGTNVTVIHADTPTGLDCRSCHDGTPPLTTDCFSCHGGSHTAPATVALHAVSGGCFTSACHHWGDVSLIHTKGDQKPGCIACHNGDPLTTNCGTAGCHSAAEAPHDTVTPHTFTHASAAGTQSTTCADCHGTDLPTVHTNLGCFCHTGALFDLSTTMQPLLAAGEAECVDCHTGPYAAHGFAGSFGGHNTNTYGTRSFSKWDGSQGVVVKDSAGTTITQEWPLPPSGVFWSDSIGLGDPAYSVNPTDAPAVALANKGFTGDPTTMINKTVGWGSVISCSDCHTGVGSSMGPQGANAGQIGLDPNFPDDWTKAEITSFDPTGMRSIATTAGSPNPYYRKIGSKVWPPEGSSGQSTRGNVWKNGSNVGTATIDEGGFYDTTTSPSNGYSAGVITGRFICMKCHKLTNSFQGLGIEGNGRGFRSNNFNYMGFSNEAHMEHHADMITGQANCVSCHIAIPHGWKRPRLLVYESDPAPYKVQWVFPGYQDLALAKSATADLSNGNWGYVGTGGTSTYKLIGSAIPNGVANGQNGIDAAGTIINNAGKTYSSHLEKVAASDTAHKELVIGPATHFGPNDTFNGTQWGLWDAAKTGSEWHPDTSPNALYSNEAIQNNCSGCTSAGTTHSDTGGSSEGVADSPSRANTPIPFWE